MNNNKKVDFLVMADAIYDIGLPPDGCSSECETAWDLECKSAFEFGGWIEKDFWDEYYMRKAQEDINELTK